MWTAETNCGRVTQKSLTYRDLAENQLYVGTMMRRKTDYSPRNA
jgi:hypothetical protein